MRQSPLVALADSVPSSEAATPMHAASPQLPDGAAPAGALAAADGAAAAAAAQQQRPAVPRSYFLRDASDSGGGIGSSGSRGAAAERLRSLEKLPSQVIPQLFGRGDSSDLDTLEPAPAGSSQPRSALQAALAAQAITAQVQQQQQQQQQRPIGGDAAAAASAAETVPGVLTWRQPHQQEAAASDGVQQLRGSRPEGGSPPAPAAGLQAPSLSADFASDSTAMLRQSAKQSQGLSAVASGAPTGAVAQEAAAAPVSAEAKLGREPALGAPAASGSSIQDGMQQPAGRPIDEPAVSGNFEESMPLELERKWRR